MSKHAEAFLETLHGIPGNHVCAALNTLTPGFNWNGCPKSYLAEQYAVAFERPELSIKVLRKVNLHDLAARARARRQGVPYWERVTA
mgnify:CR=1 FL=1